MTELLDNRSAGKPRAAGKRYTQTFLIGKGGKRLSLTGRFAWALEKLIKAGDKGITAFDDIGPRLSHYIFMLRHEHGLSIETVDERHGGQFSGTHARYILRTKGAIAPNPNAPLATILTEALARNDARAA